jgi:DNA polymerase-3 subunit beta
MTQTQAPAEATARFTATHRDLSTALKTVALGVSSRPVVPILGGVLAETRDGALTLRGFDFETAVSVRVDCDAASDGLSVLHLGELKNVLAASVAGEKAAVAAATPVSLDGGLLSTPDMAVPLDVLPPEEYPAFPPAAPAVATVDGADWFRQLDRVLPAAGSDDTRPVLTSVHVRVADGVLRLTASDCYRLAVAEVKATEGGREATEFLVSAAVLAEMSKLLGKHTGPVTVGADPDGWVTFTAGPVTVTTRSRSLVNDFPKVWNMIPAEATPVSVRADREALVRAVRKASALSKAKGLKAPRVHLDFGPDGLVVSPGLDVAEEQARVRGIPAPGEPLAGGVLDGPLKVNGIFLLDALRAFSGETLVVHAQAPSRPFLLTDGVSVAGEGFRLLLMPVRIR